jgi:single-stranded DNA-binding protein
VNKFIFTGNVGSNPEVIKNGCKLSICNAYWNGKESKNLWVDVLVFGQQVESCMTYLTVGGKVLIEGRLEKGLANGKFIVIAENVEFL